MKKSLSVLMMAAMVAGTSLTACSSKPAETTAAETAAEENNEQKTTEENAAETADEENTLEEEEVSADEEKAAEEDSLSEEELTAHYRDFADSLQHIIGEKNLDDLAELMVYPSYIGIDDGVVVESEEELLALDANKVFTDELIAAVEAAELDSIEPVEAGFVVGDESGTPSVTFGLDEEENIGIVGINY